MLSIFNKIKSTFEANKKVFTDRGLPFIRTIDIHIGQPDDPDNFEVFTPSMFLSWDIKPGNAMGESDTLTIDVHVLQEPQGSVGTEYMGVITAVKYLLNRLKTDTSTPLEYAGERPAATQYFRYHILTYTCKVDAYTETVHRNPDVDTSIEQIDISGANLRDKHPTTNLTIDTFTR